MHTYSIEAQWSENWEETGRERKFKHLASWFCIVKQKGASVIAQWILRTDTVKKLLRYTKRPPLQRIKNRCRGEWKSASLHGIGHTFREHSQCQLTTFIAQWLRCTSISLSKIGEMVNFPFSFCFLSGLRLLRLNRTDPNFVSLKWERKKNWHAENEMQRQWTGNNKKKMRKIEKLCRSTKESGEKMQVQSTQSLSLIYDKNDRKKRS